MAIASGRVLTGLAAAALLAAAPAAAQIEPGERVRVHVAGQRSIVGTLRSLDEATLVVKAEGSNDVVTVSRSRLRGVDLSERRSRKKVGGLIGFVGGAAAGVATGIAADATEETVYCIFLPPEECGNYRAGRVIAFGVLGGALGATLGAVVAPGERWGPVPADRVRVSVLTGRARAVGLSVSFRF